MSAVFPAVSGLSHRHLPLLLPGCGKPAPCAIAGHGFSQLPEVKFRRRERNRHRRFCCCPRLKSLRQLWSHKTAAGPNVETDQPRVESSWQRASWYEVVAALYRHPGAEPHPVRVRCPHESASDGRSGPNDTRGGARPAGTGRGRGVANGGRTRGGARRRARHRGGTGGDLRFGERHRAPRSGRRRVVARVARRQHPHERQRDHAPHPRPTSHWWHGRFSRHGRGEPWPDRLRGWRRVRRWHGVCRSACDHGRGPPRVWRDPL